MNVRGRIERLEGAARLAGAVRFRVIVPPKMSREEWQRYCRERPGGHSRFTIDLDGAGVFGGEDEGHGGQG